MIKKSVEYVIRAKNKRGTIFVPNSYQSDVSKAIEIYNSYKNEMEAKSTATIVTIEKHIIRTSVEDFTATADKMLKGK